MEERVRWLDQNCITCDSRLNSWDAKISKALQYRNMKCEKCIAEEYGETIKDLRDIMKSVFGLLPCQGI